MNEDAILQKLDEIVAELRARPRHAEHLVEFEKLRGQIQTINTRLAASEGGIQTQLSRLAQNIDNLAKDQKEMREKQAERDTKQQQEIDRLKLHSRYIIGIGAGIALVINFWEKVKALLFP